MSLIRSAELQDSATARLTSQTDQPGGPSVLPPFSGILNEDEELNLSNRNFKQLIKKFYKDKNITPLSQFKSPPNFPTPHVLVQFASKAYTNYKKRETDAQYETRLALPDGWKLLTTASNGSKTNGYFGAAYWHPEHQQVVIAHRGTDPTNVGALWTDVNGVLRKKYVQQMDSASTFAHEVVEVLREVKREHRVSFQLFFTGHSLGGWLAQVTTFTTEYLKKESKIYLKINNEQDCYHPHTVVFDSPGCKDMLSQMTDKLDVRLDGRSIDIEHLDITSYLSAPNRINTCNAHVGTVYRIFPDFSDMGWWETSTALYNLATHSMQKIVQAFDPETGQVYRDEQGQLKVQVVVDWPVSAGILGGEEYKRFFEWAKHLNNYHPNIKDIYFHHVNYHPIRYQSKLYDERVKGLSIFSEKEQEFLQCYRWLRQWPEFFKPKELLSAMEDNQAQEYSEKLLQSYEIESSTIRCTDAAALQALVPYVKRLLQLFPEIKENIKRALSSDEVRNRVYQIETRRFVERISQSPLEFNSDASSFREFLESEEQKLLNLRMVDADEWTGLMKVYRVLQQTGCLVEGQYTVLELKRLLTLNQMIDLSKLMLSTVTPYLLLMACEENQHLDRETKKVIRKIFDTIKRKPNIKVIITTRLGGSAVAFLHHMGRRISGKGFVRRVEQLTWSDLTTSSQEKLLEKSVEFQGSKISLNKIMFAESAAAKFLPLGALLEEKQLKIADPVPISNDYNSLYYIERDFRHHIAIKQDIYSEKCKKQFRDLLASSEQEFKHICQLNPRNNVHWLVKEESGKLIWKQSQGSLETLRRYIDTESSQIYTAGDLDKLVEQAEHQRVMLISDTAGMGKSTVLTHLSEQIKQKFPENWVVRIDFNDHTDALKELEQQEFDKERAIKFISEKLLKLKTGLERELFKKSCEQKQKVRIVIMLDGFDEVCPFYKQTVIGLLQALRQTAVEQLWVTTRPHLREELEDKLQQLSCTLEPFSEKEQVEYLIKFWGIKDWFTESEEKEKDTKKKKLEIYAKHLIKGLAQSVRDKDKQFTGIPLQTRILAEAFNEEVKTFCQSAISVPQLPFQLDLRELYERFIERKYDIFQEEKCRVQASNVVAIGQKERELKSMREDHQLLALKVLFTEEQVALFQNNRECSFSAEELARIGIVQVNCEGKPQFIHRTFAEYYVADCLAKHLTEGNKPSQQVLDFILKVVLQEAEFRVIRVFIDAFLSRSQPSDEVIKHFGRRIHALGTDRVRMLLNVAVEGDANIIRFLLDMLLEAGDRITYTIMSNFEDCRLSASFRPLTNREDLYRDYFQSRWIESRKRTAEHERNLPFIFTRNYGRTDKSVELREIWEWAEENLTREQIYNRLLYVTGYNEGSAWHLAAEEGNLHVFQKIWEWAKQDLTTKEIRNKLLLATDKEGRTAWHVAAEGGKLDLLQIIWEWAKETLTREEINTKLLLATDEKGRTAWHVAAEGGKLGLLQIIWEWAKQNLTREEINTKLLLATDNERRTALHVAAAGGSISLFEELWRLSAETLTTKELRSKLLVALDANGRTPWHVAAELGKLVLLQWIWKLAKENLTKEEINCNLLLAKDKMGRTAWHVAAEGRKLCLLHKIWEWAKDNLTKEEISNTLLLATDDMGRTTWHVAAKVGELVILEKIWEWTKEKLTTVEMINIMLLAADNMGRTAWHMAAESGNVNALGKVWEWAKEKLTTEEIINIMLLATDKRGKTILHIVTHGLGSNVILEVWEWAKENLTTDEIINKILLATDGEGRTAWHVAAEAGELNMLQEIWEWTKENQIKEEINNKLLLATDENGKTAWHVAAETDELNILQEIWVWAKENLTKEGTNNKLLLATDKRGMSILHIVTESACLTAILKIWDWAKENLTKEEINNKLLLATEKRGKTILHIATERACLAVILKIWEWAKENLTTEEINNKLLLATDDKGRTAWHVAAETGKLDILQKIWEWAKENLTNEEINKKFLLATEKRGKTILHIVTERISLNVILKIWRWAKENLTTEEIINKFLLATDDKGKTAWHIAAENAT